MKLDCLQGAVLAEAFRSASQSYVTPQDRDRIVADELGPRWSVMGPFATIALNAPGGIRDGCGRQTGSYERLAAEPALPREAVLTHGSMAADGPDRGRRRGARLAALRAHRNHRQDKS